MGDKTDFHMSPCVFSSNIIFFRLQKLRKERSAKAARDRRTKENVEYDKVKDLLPIDAGKTIEM